MARSLFLGHRARQRSSSTWFEAILAAMTCSLNPVTSFLAMRSNQISRLLFIDLHVRRYGFPEKLAADHAAGYSILRPTDRAIESNLGRSPNPHKLGYTAPLAGTPL
ncbi:hypothetical protein O181_095145 [Austropuccinia psidii MF-1]|uniref:Uncharacterized protein n=1 Tax=Austropuccinia psidii MF-1 TaxID=1389203 RepID=A0A9Q3J511_9BASI|nr:hypothetical protein [Austropuccinia psidii MF-1]